MVSRGLLRGHNTLQTAVVLVLSSSNTSNVTAAVPPEDASPLVDTSESCPETIIDATAPDCDEPELEAAGKRAGLS